MHILHIEPWCIRETHRTQGQPLSTSPRSCTFENCWLILGPPKIYPLLGPLSQVTFVLCSQVLKVGGVLMKSGQPGSPLKEVRNPKNLTQFGLHMRVLEVEFTKWVTIRKSWNQLAASFWPDSGTSPVDSPPELSPCGLITFCCGFGDSGGPQIIPALR